jgi:general secretion pathway protein G
MKSLVKLYARPQQPSSGKRALWLGFTLLELMIVITILLILMTIGIGRYETSVRRAKEASLHSSLRVMREAIDNYTLDKQAAPQSLEDLVSAQYLRFVPFDPITHAKDWNVTMDEVVLSPEQTSTGITDVHSSSTQVSPFESTPYNTW